MFQQMYLKRNIWFLSAVVSWDRNFIMELWEKCVFIYVALGNLSQLMDLLIVLPDISVFSHNVGLTILCTTAVTKICRIICFKGKLKELLNFVEVAEVRVLNRSDKEINIFMKAIEKQWLVTKVYGVLSICTVVVYFIGRPMEYFFGGLKRANCNKVPFIYSAWFPLDNCKFYYFIYGFEIGFAIIAAFYLFAIDMFIIGILRFIIGQFKLIQIGLKDLLTNQTKMVSNDLYDVYGELIEIIEHHLCMIKFVEALDNYLSLTTIIHFILCALMLCTVTLEAVMSGASFQQMMSLQTLLAMLVELFIIYWHSNEISYQSTKVATCVSECDWYQFCDQTKKALLLLMIRAQKPCQLTVGGYYSVSLNTFLLILRGAYSFFALFREFYNK